jgi:hypothetical protein
VGALGSDAHRVLIEQIADYYHGDVRVRAVAVFGSVSTGAWHGGASNPRLFDVSLGKAGEAVLSAGQPALTQAVYSDRRN